ncbi:BREX system P-loop protein BrxC [Aequorivita sinensis]|uniref:BREX system P-loop protein BrxC n=1 Tax=Aequorivita sinensis TaxID=1382458 RepID=UPI0023013EA5|nr:BREX system P-loop protein BrxC [Aequorivita sinensis]
MIIKDFFEKDINRNIETVIKADDRDQISNEVEEYVITNEIGEKIRDLFQAYNNYAGVNGVWISGFFGSGKSHLLKILSYVFENKKFDGDESGKVFANKITNDEMLKGDVLAATRIPSESVLFNIDQQAQITSKEDPNAILSVFYKVFYDHLGFYGSKRPVAEFEMWLNSENKWQSFQEAYLEKSGNNWTDDRRKYFAPKVKQKLGEVLGELFDDDASKYQNIIDTMRKDSTSSIEDFCVRVQEYIASKPKGFRLNFFVDEVGQYISDNTKLMLNLQTVAETLATRTKGKSWILVTSQEDMEKVVGDMNKSQQNDFSRIQARFAIKVPLTSANVDEVIEKRLLSKNEDAQKQLMASYKETSAQLDTLLSFSEAGVQFKGFSDASDFGNKFPFVPYQFDLFQQCRRALSMHNAFQGKHASVGERSMLGVFQQVTQIIEDKGVQALVSFDLMYEGIRNELRGEIQSSVIMAERNLDNPFAIKVLKALFLVKYFGNFKTTKRNVSVLLIDDIQVDLNEHNQKIEEALNILENQSYVQRNGDVYEFLTDDEKDVEEEIKNTDIDDQAVTQLLKELFFDEIIRDNKIKFLDNKQDYDFTSKIDGSLLGREKELFIEIITENFADYDNDTFHQSQTMGTTGMKLKLASNALFMKDLKMYLRTNKYVKQNQSTSNRVEVKRILQEKAQQNAERRRNLIIMANNTLADAEVFMNGSKHESGHSKEGKTKVINAFQDLIKQVYPNLKMLGSNLITEDAIRNTVRSKQDDLFGTDDKTISEAESEILNFIKRRKKQSDRTSLNDIKSQFTKKPYGWYPNAIWTLTAKLYKRGKVELKQNASLLEDEDVLTSLINSSNHGSTLLEPQTEVDPRQLKHLKELYADAFDETTGLKEAKDVAVAFKEKIKDLAAEVKQLYYRKTDFPFLSVLEGFSERLQRLSDKDYKYFLTSISDFEDDLLDNKEDLLDPIKSFINGEQANIYLDIKKLVNSNTANIDYIEGDEFETLTALINSKTPYKGNAIQIAKAAKDSLTKKVIEGIDNEKKHFNDKLDSIFSDIEKTESFKQLNTDQQDEIKNTIISLKEKVKAERFIGNIRNEIRKVEDNFYNDQLNHIAKLLAPKDESGKAKEPKAKYIKKTSIYVDYPNRELTSEEDVLEYTEALKKAYLERINQNLKITL